MCGIAGIYSPQSTDLQRSHEVVQMLQAIKHRGPDGRAIFTDKGIGIGVVRLAMVDTMTAATVFSNEATTVRAVFNGEIYNHRELRDNLKKQGHGFKTQNDGEILVHLYEEYGKNFVKKLDGMFSFALWDGTKGCLILARDRMGVKPLYFQETTNGVVFASELKAIKECNSRLSVDDKALADFFQLRFIRAPRTIFKGVYKLEPGCVATVGPDGIKIGRYWKPHFDEKDVQKNFGEVLCRAVESTSQADTPLAVFLSGGLDSSSVLAALARVNQPLASFTIGYDDNTTDESPYAALLAKYFNSKHTNVIINNDQILELVNQAVDYLEEPFYSTVSLSTFALSRAASRDFKGVLTGDGSDELLMGYHYLLNAQKIARDGGDWRKAYAEQLGWIPKRWKERLLKDMRHITLDFDEMLSPDDSLRYFELRYRLPDYHLLRVDRMTMAWGLEGRVPFLRQDVVDWALSQSTSKLLVDGKQKEVLKNAFHSSLPVRIRERRKQPFTAPYENWLLGPLKDDVRSLLLDSGYERFLGLHKRGVEELVTECYKQGSNLAQLWGVYMLYKWYDANKAKVY